MVLAVSTFTCLDTTSKYLSQYYPVPGIVWARYLVQMVLMIVVLGPRMGLGLVRTTNLRLQSIRGIVLAASSLVFLSALSLMPLAEAASIAFMTPIIVAVLAVPVLGERVDARTWLALAGGFSGVLLIIRPGGDAFTWWALLPLACAFLFAFYQILTRKLAGHDDPITTLFYPGLIACFVVPPVFPGWLTVPTVPLHAAMLVAVGILGAVGHFLLIRAHGLAPATLLAPFGYAQLVVVMVLGFLLFGELPDGIALAGIALIAGSGLGLILASRRPA